MTHKLRGSNLDQQRHRAGVAPGKGENRQEHAILNSCSARLTLRCSEVYHTTPSEAAEVVSLSVKMVNEVF